MLLLLLHVLFIVVALLLLLPRSEPLVEAVQTAQSLSIEQHQSITRARMQQLASFLRAEFHPLSGFPGSLTSLEVVTRLYGSTAQGIAQPLLIDTWNRQFQYKRLLGSAGFELTSFGADGRAGGDGPATDLHLTYSIDNRRPGAGQ